MKKENMTDVDYERKQPASIIAEQSLLGCILIDPQMISEIAGEINEDDFYLTDHAQIFSAMLRLFNESHEIDVVTLIDTLVKNGVYDKQNGQDYIMTISQIVPNAMNIKDYARIIKEKKILRQLIDAASEISEEAYSEQAPVSEILDSAQNSIYQISQGRDVHGFRHIRDLLSDVFENISAMANNDESVQTVDTGFSNLDRVLVGMGKGDLVLIGARPGMGKTSFALNIALNVAKKTRKEVCIFSLEMSAEQIAMRMLSTEAMVDSKKLRSGDLNDEDWKRIGDTSNELHNYDIVVDDTSDATVTNMRGKIRKELNKKKDIGLIIVDYLQLMQSERRIDNRVLEIGDISRSLKLMAKDFQIPIICCAQLSRKPEGRNTQKPMLSDLRDSGAIEQDADMVMFLYREDYYNEEIDSNGQNLIAEVVVAKNRHGELGNVKLGWIPKFTKFRPIENEQFLPGQN